MQANKMQAIFSGLEIHFFDVASSSMISSVRHQMEALHALGFFWVSSHTWTGSAGRREAGRSGNKPAGGRGNNEPKGRSGRGPP
jgi:hypothetical protein